ncbi:MAG: penicillin-binding transpeptidase domain-containing protein, partial [Polyangiales bacterium]
QVVPASTAHLVTDMLTGVTTAGGTGEAAALDGYLVAGKTGTAQKADPRGGYADNAWTATFVGFAPAQRPKLVVSVVIDEPVVEHYGGTVSGPVFKRIASAALRHLGVPAESQGDKLAELAKAASERRAAAEQQAVAARASEHREPGQQLSEGQVRVPELRGQGARTALITLARAGLSVTVAGTGAVVEQKPLAGSIVNLGSTVHAVLQRPGTSAPSELAMRRNVRAESESLVSMAPSATGRITR